MRLWHFELDDNPALDPGYVASLKKEYVEGSHWHRRFIQGLRVAAEGAVYDFFNETEHTIDGSPPGSQASSTSESTTAPATPPALGRTS